MKRHRILHVLCLLCASSALAKRTVEFQIRPIFNLQNVSEKFLDTTVSTSPDTQREKRAFGLILSGLAQAFGYDMNSIQIASLPIGNNAAPGNGGSTNTQVAVTKPPSMPPSTPALLEKPLPPSLSPTPAASSGTTATTPAPRQRETIRFTGVVNFGNNTSLLSHLQQYESIFHGQSTTETPATTLASSTPTSVPTLPFDAREVTDKKPPLLSPFFVKIPLPVVGDLPAPIPATEDFNLSYPKPFVPIGSAEPETKKKVTSTQSANYDSELYARLAELERKQEEQARRLKEQERFKNQGENDQSGERGTGGKYEKGKENETYEDDYSSGEEEDSREKYESAKDSREKEEEDDENSYRPYKEHEDSSPKTFSNYTSLRYTQQLPISYYNEQRRPEELRNSYGEILDSRELIDEGVVNYFEAFKTPRPDSSGLSKPQSSEGVSDQEEEEEEDSRTEKSKEDEEDEGNENFREDYNYPPARSKYEEYPLEEKTDKGRKNSKVFQGIASDGKDDYKSVVESTKQMSSNGEAESNSNEDARNEEFDFLKYTPYVVPARFVYAPNELKNAQTRVSLEKSDNLRSIPNKGVTEKIASKEHKKSLMENLNPSIGIPERLSGRKLHEGETKETQVWPAPFDYVFDSTDQTNVFPRKLQRYTNSGLQQTHQKIEAPRTRVEESLRQREKYVASVDSFKDGIASQRVGPKRAFEIANRERARITQKFDPPGEKRISDILKSYVPNYHRGRENQPHVEAVQYKIPQRSHVETTVANYYERVYPKNNLRKLEAEYGTKTITE